MSAKDQTRGPAVGTIGRTLICASLAVLLLGGLASSAGAECGWVMWTTVRYAAGQQAEIHPFASFETRAECEKRRMGSVEGKDGFLQMWTCYPGTIDPRPRSGR